MPTEEVLEQFEKTDVVRQVAEMECRRCHGRARIPTDYPQEDEPCPSCQGTGLRYPTLSRRNIQWGVEQGRIPAVTTDKVLVLLFEIVGIGMGRRPDGTYSISFNHPKDGAWSVCTGETPGLAAIAALLAVEE